jgi:hypothetical protein
MTMRARFLVLLLAAPLLAQEPAEPEKPKDADLRKEVEELRRLVEELRSKSEEKRKEAAEAIKRANVTLDDLLPVIEKALQDAEAVRAQAIGVQLWPDAELRFGFAGGAEVIRGTADGTDYTLKSLGKGNYELEATKRGEDGQVVEKIKEQGTLKELQEKHPFLKGAFTLQLPPVAAPPVVAGRFLGRNWGDRPFWTGERPDTGPKVGLVVTPPPEELRFHLVLPEGAGLIVREVVPGSRAEEIGLRRFDILVKLDGELIDSVAQVKKLHAKKGVLEIIRRSQPVKIDLTAAAAHAEEKPTEEKPPQEKPADAGPR